MTDRQVIACNMIERTSIAAAGARCYVVLPNPGGGHDRIEVLVRSHSGRWIRKWENMTRLDNFRVKTLPPEHPLHDDGRLWDRDVDVYAEQLQSAVLKHRRCIIAECTTKPNRAIRINDEVVGHVCADHYEQMPALLYELGYGHEDWAHVVVTIHPVEAS